MTLHHGDCVEVMAGMPEASVDAIVTDPPYMLGFMGKEWDTAGRQGVDDLRDRHPDPTGKSVSPFYRPGWGNGATSASTRDSQAWHQRWATEALRVAKPGAYLLAFGGTRTYHRLACAIEDAGWIIRDTLIWGFASGFPKSKSLLKPAYEPILWARKPFSVPVQYAREIHHALGALIWLFEGAPDGPGCAATRAANLFAASDTTGTSRSPAVGSTSSSIASSWSGILAVVSADGSRYTTSTGTRLTTALRTLSSCLSPAISVSTMPLCECLRDGSPSPADSAASSSSDEHTRWLDTLRRTAPASVIATIAEVVVGVCASLVADLSADLGAVPTAPDPATTRLAADSRPIVMARKPGPLRELAIDACRIGVNEREPRPGGFHRSLLNDDGWKGRDGEPSASTGRWPANVILTDPIFDGGWDGVVGGGQQSSERWADPGPVEYPDEYFGVGRNGPSHGDTGTYSRFFLIPKADRAEREPIGGTSWQPRSPSNAALSAEASSTADWSTTGEGARERGSSTNARNTPAISDPDTPASTAAGLPMPTMGPSSSALNGRRLNHHPTVKPLDLMRHLVRLVTPTGGTVLDPFLGSGTTAIAAEMEGFQWVGIEREAEYVAIAEARLQGVQRGLGLDVAAPTPTYRPPPDSKMPPIRHKGPKGWSGRWASDNRDDVA